MDNDVKIVYKSIPLPILVSLIFMTLKLCKVIAWSWWWVFAPIWIPVSLGIIGILIFIIVGVIVTIRTMRGH